VLKKLESASKKTKRKYAEREKLAKVEHALDEQFTAGRVLGNTTVGRL
jgi:hypothetical protein